MYNIFYMFTLTRLIIFTLSKDMHAIITGLSNYINKISIQLLFKSSCTNECQLQMRTRPGRRKTLNRNNKNLMYLKETTKLQGTMSSGFTDNDSKLPYLQYTFLFYFLKLSSLKNISQYSLIMFIFKCDLLEFLTLDL